jgi:predicted PurR-regulated permease PerM
MIEVMNADNKDRISSLHTVVDNIAKDVSSLSKILRDGNGQPPLLTRVALVEQSTQDATKDVHELREDVEAQKSTASTRTFQTVTTVVSSLISIIMMILMALVVAGLK